MPDPTPQIPPAGAGDVSARLVAFLRGLVLGAAVAAIAAVVELLQGGNFDPEVLWPAALAAGLRWLAEGFVFDKDAPASAAPFSGAVSEPAKAQIITEGIEAIQALPE